MHSSATCFVTQYHVSEIYISHSYIMDGVSVVFNILLSQIMLLRIFLCISSLGKSRSFSEPKLLGCRVCTFSTLQNSVWVVSIYTFTKQYLRVLIIQQF